MAHLDDQLEPDVRGDVVHRCMYERHQPQLRADLHYSKYSIIIAAAGVRRFKIKFPDS